jgi:hypothetical protein
MIDRHISYGEELLEQDIMELIDSSGRAVARSAIEAVLSEHDAHGASDITRGLRALENSGRLVRTSLDVSGSEGQHVHVYSIGDPRKEDVQRLLVLARKKAQLFSPNVLRVCGERYVRCVLIASRSYNRITQKHRLGRIRLDFQGRQGDLLAQIRGTRSEAVGPILFEVKNQRECFYPTDKLFGELLLKALTSGVGQPALVASHLSEEARSYCARWGIAFLELGRQVFPRSWRDDVESLREILGPIAIEYINPSRPFQHRVSPSSQRDIESVQKQEWVPSANRTWRSNRLLAEQFAGSLAHNTFPQLLQIVQRRLAPMAA